MWGSAYAAGREKLPNWPSSSSMIDTDMIRASKLALKHARIRS
jgi:hypothetical protein